MLHSHKLDVVNGKSGFYIEVCVHQTVGREKRLEFPPSPPQEWNTNHEYYQGFITTGITTLAHEPLQSGQFSGSAGDLMVLTLANILQMPITITVFTSVSNMPVLCIMPTTHSALTSQPIFLAYTQTGPGHYDCVVPIESSDSAKTKQKKNKMYLWKKPQEPWNCVFIFEMCMCQRKERVYV